MSDELESDIELLVDNAIMAEIMRLAGDMVVVVNEHRQIIAANKGFLQFLGIEGAKSLLGKRLGATAFLGFRIAYRWDLPVGPTDVVLLGVPYAAAWFAAKLLLGGSRRFTNKL